MRSSRESPTPVRYPAMVQHWDTLTFMHWAYPADTVQALLPDSLTVETFHGSAWVGLVPFVMRAGLPWAPSIPWLTEFPETAVRTYARTADGTTGIWALSVDSARLAAVLAARATLRMPYHWARMRVSVLGNVVTYEMKRRWPGPRGTASGVAVEVGELLAPASVSAFDHMLTARWTVFRGPRSRPGLARVQHERWPLHRAKLLHVDDGLLPAAGLPPPSGVPVVHYSPTVAVRVGWSQRLARARGLWTSQAAPARPA